MKNGNKFYINNQDGFYGCVNVGIIMLFSIFTIFMLFAGVLGGSNSRYIALLAILPGSIAYLGILSFSHRKISIEIGENELFINIPQKKYSKKMSKHSFKFDDILNIYRDYEMFHLGSGPTQWYISLLINLKNGKKISLKWRDIMGLRSKTQISGRKTLLEMFLNELENKKITILRMHGNQQINPELSFGLPGGLPSFSCDIF